MEITTRSEEEVRKGKQQVEKKTRRKEGEAGKKSKRTRRGKEREGERKNS